MGIGCRVR